MTPKTSGDSTPGVSTNIFRGIQDSFTTQGLPTSKARKTGESAGRPASPGREPQAAAGVKPPRARRVGVDQRSRPTPYALFCNEAKLSKAYPTEADVWKLARQSGLVVDEISDEEKPEPRPVLDNDYEIKPCRADPQEDPAKNKAEAERADLVEFHLNS